MKALAAFLLLFSALTQITFAQDVAGNGKTEEKIIIRLNPVVDLQLVRSDSNNSNLQVLSTKDWILNVNTDKNNPPLETVSIKAVSGDYVSISSDPANLLSGNPASSNKSTGKLALNYLTSAGSKPINYRESVNVIFTLTNK